MLHKYGAVYRPIAFAQVPPGYVAVEKHPNFRHGVAVYERELTPSEVESFELVPLVPTSTIIEKLAEPFREYADEYLQMNEKYPSDLEVMIGQAFEKLNLYPGDGKFDRAGFTKAVVAKLKRPVGGKSRHPKPPHGRRRTPRKGPMKPQSVKRRWREYDANVREAGKMAAAASKPVTGETAKLLLELGAALKS